LDFIFGYDINYHRKQQTSQASKAREEEEHWKWKLMKNVSTASKPAEPASKQAAGKGNL